MRRWSPAQPGRWAGCEAGLVLLGRTPLSTLDVRTPCFVHYSDASTHTVMYSLLVEAAAPAGGC